MKLLKGTGKLTNHTVILNWNTRAAEILSELIYTGRREEVAIVVPNAKGNIEQEIQYAIEETIERENERVEREADKLLRDGIITARGSYISKNSLTDNLSVAVCVGETFSLRVLNEVCVSHARTVIILGKDAAHDDNRHERQEVPRSNVNTIKTLMQVAELTSNISSADNQRVVVEAEDSRTYSLIRKIIRHKERRGKCNIIAMPVNKMLGQILSQLALMPELNLVYSDLFSNKGASFYTFKVPESSGMVEGEHFDSFFGTHPGAVPLSVMQYDFGRELVYIANDEVTPDDVEMPAEPVSKLSIDNNYDMGKKYVAMFGHNSKCPEIMANFASFLDEWDPGRKGLLELVVIDNPRHLEQERNYEDYWFVSEVVPAEIFEQDKIQNKLSAFVDAHEGSTSVLILSDDLASNDNMDANVLTSLIYVRDLMNSKLDENPNYPVEKINIIAEILDPRNEEILENYSVHNSIIISNRYISKMITQIGGKRAIYEFYKDILRYDGLDDATDGVFTSREIYIKPVSKFFEKGQYPGLCAARDLIKSIYDASPNDNKCILIGYVRLDGSLILFTGEEANRTVQLTEGDRLVVFARH